MLGAPLPLSRQSRIVAFTRATRATGHVADMPKSTRMTRADLGTARAFNLYVADSAIEGAGELRRINARLELLSRD